MYIKREVPEKRQKLTGSTTLNMYIDCFCVKLKQNVQNPKDAMIFTCSQGFDFFDMPLYVVCLGISLQNNAYFLLAHKEGLPFL